MHLSQTYTLGQGQGQGGRGQAISQQPPAFHQKPQGGGKTSGVTGQVGCGNEAKHDLSTASQPSGRSEKQRTGTPTPPVGMTTGPGGQTVDTHKAARAPSSTQTKAGPQTAPVVAPHQPTR